MNNVIDYRLTLVGYAEPVSLAEARAYGRLNDTPAEDDLIESLITASRQAIEAYTRLSLIPKTAEVILDVNQPMMELPFGPVTGTVTFKDEDGNTLSSVGIIGLDFPKIKEAYTNGYLTAEYSCGYGELPSDLRTAILDQFVFNYQNRGDNQDSATVCLKAQKSLLKYSRQAFFI